MAHDDTSLRPLLLSWLALMILLGSTLGLAFVPMGSLNLVLALCIAALKALIVFAVFMELWSGPSLKWVFAGAGFFWLMIMFFLTGADYLTREMRWVG
jgi:cytochrome c oxidase subunit IV